MFDSKNIMLQPKFQVNLDNNLEHLKKSPRLENSFLTLFLYLSPSKGENLEVLIQFFQKYDLKVERLKQNQNKNRSHTSKTYMMNNNYNNANFIAQSRHAFSPIEFQGLVKLLPPNIIVVAIFYQKQIWNFLRLQKLGTNSISTLSLTNKVPFLLKQSEIFWKNLQRVHF